MEKVECSGMYNAHFRAVFVIGQTECGPSFISKQVRLIISKVTVTGTLITNHPTFSGEGSSTSKSPDSIGNVKAFKRKSGSFPTRCNQLRIIYS